MSQYLIVSIVLLVRLTSVRLDAIRQARRWVLTTSAVQHQESRRDSGIETLEPKYNIEDLLGIINPDIRLPLDMMEVLLRIVDDSRIMLFKPQFGKGMITAWAHICGTHLFDFQNMF